MNYRNPIYTLDGRIDCEIEHRKFGWIPFTADPNDCEEHGRELFLRIEEEGNISPYAPPPPPSEEELSEKIINERNMLLVQTDWTQLPDVPEKTRELWAEYRQLLRDIPQQETFPYSVVFPEPPKR